MYLGTHVSPERRSGGADVSADILFHTVAVEGATMLVDPCLAKGVHRARSHTMLEHESFELLCALWIVQPRVLHDDVRVRERSRRRLNQIFPIRKIRGAVPIRDAIRQRGS